MQINYKMSSEEYDALPVVGVDAPPFVSMDYRDHDHYDQTTESRNNRVIIVGAGGLGANIAILLAKELCLTTIIDGDVCDRKWRRRIVAPVQWGDLVDNTPKVQVLRESIKSMVPGAVPFAIPQYINNQTVSGIRDRILNNGSSYRALIVTVDDLEARQFIERKLGDLAIDVWQIGCNDGSVTITKSLLGGGDNQVYGAVDGDGDEVLPPEGSSYLREPDAMTYMAAAVLAATAVTGRGVEVYD